MKIRYALLVVLMAGGLLGSFVARSQDLPESLLTRLANADEGQLRILLQRFPVADANGDGRLTREEAITYARTAIKGGGAAQGKSGSGKGPLPLHADIAYGPADRNVLDFWKAEGEGARPLVVFIHGGGFTGGDKSNWRGSSQMKRLLDSGVSCAAINYRFRKDAPIQDILRDAARAVQFLRAQATEWEIDKTRFAGWGGSAGAGTSLWLAARDDLAEAAASDPILRESSRLQAAVLESTQATYDLTRWESFLGPADPSWWKSPNETAEFYHFTKLSDLATPEALLVLHECDMLRWITPGDGPVFINNRLPDGPSKDRNHYLHHPGHAREIESACENAGVRCFWVESAKHKATDTDPVEFVLNVLLSGGG